MRILTSPRQLSESEGLLLEMYDWALRACHQGTGRPYGTPEWHLYVTTWTDAEDLLPRVAAALGLEPPDPKERRAV